MLPPSGALRVFIYDWILRQGLPPSSHEIGRHFACTPDQARQAISAMKVGKTVLGNPRTGEIWMAGPFASEATPYRVKGASTQWWANCAWDMLGIPMIAGERVRIDARCTCCREPVAIEAGPGTPTTDDLVVHFLLPARRWYDDIGYT